MEPMPRITLPLLLTALIALCACGREADEIAPGGPAGAGGEVEGTLGLFTLLHDAEAEARPPAVSVSGQFLHYRNVSRPLAVRALDPTVGALEWAGARDQCRIEESADERVRGIDAEPLDYRIDLLDAGTLVSATASVRVVMPPRHFPEILPELSGVVYGAAEDQALPFSPETEYVLSGGGGDEVGPFRVELPAPRDLDPGDLVLLPLADGGLEVQWGDGDPDADLAHLELTRGGSSLLCAADDRGSFRLRAADLAKLAGDGELGLTVRRVRSQTFSAPGVPRAEAIFVVQARSEAVADVR